MTDCGSLNHTKWACQYHLVFKLTALLGDILLTGNMPGWWISLRREARHSVASPIPRARHRWLRSQPAPTERRHPRIGVSTRRAAP